jgi:hypothetical protein
VPPLSPPGGPHLTEPPPPSSPAPASTMPGRCPPSPCPTGAHLRHARPLPVAQTPLLLHLPPTPPHTGPPTFFPYFPPLWHRSHRVDPSSPAVPVTPSRPCPSTLLPPSHHPDRLLSAPIIGEPFFVMVSVPLPPFPPPLVRVDPSAILPFKHRLTSNL